MQNYRVKWEIYIVADNPEQAARKALAVQRDPDSTAVVFHVEDSKEITIVDVEYIGFTNYYHCETCDCDWVDSWDSMCNDKCPQCNAEIEPYASEET